MATLTGTHVTNDGCEFWLSVDYSITVNASNVVVTLTNLKLNKNKEGSKNFSGVTSTATVSINGASVYSNTSQRTFNSGTSLTLASTVGTKTINRNSDGSLGNISISASIKNTSTSTNLGFGQKVPSLSASVPSGASKYTYTVSYNANGGSGAPSSQTKTYGVALTLSSTKPTRDGYIFKYWNTNANGTGTTYDVGGSYTGNANVTLYAIWEVASPKITITGYRVKENGSTVRDENGIWACFFVTYSYATSTGTTTRTFKRGSDVVGYVSDNTISGTYTFYEANYAVSTTYTYTFTLVDSKYGTSNVVTLTIPANGDIALRFNRTDKSIKTNYSINTTRNMFVENASPYVQLHHGNGQKLSLWTDTANKGLYDDNLSKFFIYINSDHNSHVGIDEYITVLHGKSVRLGSTSGSVVTSDRNLKDNIETLDRDGFFDSLKPRTYKYKLGTSNRTHVGFITQEVEEALRNNGLTTQDFGGVVITKDIKEDEEQSFAFLLDKGIHEEHDLIYSEFIALNTDQIQKLKKRVRELEDRIEKLEKLLTR